MPLDSLLPSRKTLLIFALAAAIIGGAVWWTSPPPDPVYQGKRLSQWMREYNFADTHANLPQSALRAMGRPGMDYLVYELEHGREDESSRADSGLHRFFVALAHRGQDTPNTDLRNDRLTAAWLLGEMGPVAEPAIPALCRQLQQMREEQPWVVAVALHRIGPASWPTVEERLAHGSVNERRLLVKAVPFRMTLVGRIAPDVPMAPNPEIRRALDILVRALSDPQFQIRAAGADGLSVCARFPDQPAVDENLPALIALLDDSSGTVRAEAALALMNFGTRAAAAIPHLIELLDAPEDSIRNVAASTLGKVDIAEKRSAPRLLQMAHDSTRPRCQERAQHALKAFGMDPGP